MRIETMTTKKDLLDDDIMQNLRRVYGGAVQEPIPDRFAKLLDQLRSKDAAQMSHASGEDETSK